ncbi:hypothetical protein [Acidisoma sp. C75]
MTAMRLSRFTLALTLALIAPAAAWAAESGRSAAALRAEILARYHVRVIEHDLTQRIVPLVATPDRPVKMRDLSPENETACLQAVKTAFVAYPAAFVSSLVGRLALADDLSAWNIRGGAFHTPGLIALNCVQADANEAFDVDSIHDEIAALVLIKMPLDRAAWDAFNPQGFTYGDTASYHAELRHPHSRAGNAALHAKGFVSALGMTGIDNDFQAYAERIFGHPAGFAQLLQAYPAMRGKAAMVMALYRRLSPALGDRLRSSELLAAAGQAP